MKERSYNFGVLCIFLYGLVYSISQVAIGYYEVTISPYLLATYVFLITAVFYTSVAFLKYKNTLKLVANNFTVVIKFNVSTAVAWLTIIYALQYLLPAVALAISFGVLSIFTIIVSLTNKNAANPAPIDYLFSTILFFLIATLCIYVFYNDLTSHAVPMSDLIYGISLSILSAAGNAYNLVFAKILSQNKFNTSQVLASRFYLSFIAAFVILLVTHTTILPIASEISPIVLIAFISTIVPVYFVQLGVTYANPIIVALIAPILPAITFFLELFNPKIKFSIELLILTASISLTIFFLTAYKIRKNKVLIRQ